MEEEKLQNVVFLPGLLCNALFFASTINTVGAFANCHVFDHTRDNSMASMAARVLAEAPPRFSICGHSMGGYLTFEILRQGADRIEKIVFVSTSARADTKSAQTDRLQWITDAQRGKFEEIAIEINSQGVPDHLLVAGGIGQVIQDMANETGLQGFINQMQANMTRPDSRDTLSCITQKSLVLVGDQDDVTPVDRALEISQTAPNVTLSIYPDRGHLLCLEDPKKTSVEIAEFLRDA